jgi:hypothetical protein
MSISETIKFRITLDDIENKIVFNDLTDYTGYTMSGILRISRNGEAIYVNSGFETNNLSSPDVTNAVLEKELPDIDITKGVYKVEYKLNIVTSGGKVLFVTKFREYNFQSAAPQMNVKWSVDYITSELSIVDHSTYVISTPDGNIIETSISRRVKVRPPIGTPMLTYDQEDQPAVVVIGPPIYTTNYDVKVESTLSYNLEVWDGDVWVIFKTKPVYIDSFNVEFDDDCIASCLACVRQLGEKMQDARKRSQREADYFERMVYDVSFYYGVYMMTKAAGQDPQFACDKIKEILRKECVVDLSPSKTPMLIPAIAGGGSGEPGEPGTKWLSGTTVPTPGSGVMGDFYLKTDDGKVYKKTSDTNWTHIMTLWVKGRRLTKTVYGNYDMSPFDDVVFVSPLSSMMITLPSGLNEGNEFVIKVITLNNSVVIIPNVGTINGSSFYQFGTVGDSIHIVLRGTNWEII